MILLLLLTLDVTRDKVDILEINSCGRFTQLIFWEQPPGFARRHAIDWAYLPKDFTILHKNNRSFARFSRNRKTFLVEFSVLIRTKTTYDPEFLDRREFPLVPRRGLGR